MSTADSIVKWALGLRPRRRGLPSSTAGSAIAAAIAIAWVVAPTTATAQAWPAKPIKFLVGYPPGGGADLAARVFSEPMSRGLGQPIVVENRPGASGAIAASAAARSEPDGYTLFVAAISDISIAPAVVKDLSYDPSQDLKPIVMFAKWSQILVAGPNFPPNTLAELIAYVKANPGKVSYSSFGNNTLNHIKGESFKAVLHLDVLHVPYKGSGPSLTGIMGGHVQYTFDAPGTTINLIQSGKLKAIAVAGANRLASAPDIPTMADAGLPNFYVNSWIGLLAPAHTPDAIVQRLNKEALAALELPEVQSALKKSNSDPGGGTPAEFGQRIRAEIAEYRQIASQIGIVPQ